jgi:two-component system OmpR family sensor kinase
VRSRPLPVRLRVTAVFALAMAVVLAGTGLFLYARLDSRLSAALDRDLRLRAQDLSELVRRPGSSLAATGARLVERGESYAQLVDARGRVLDATRPLGGSALLSSAQLTRAGAATTFANLGPIPGLDDPSRVLATQIDRGGAHLVLVVGATRQDNADTLAGLRNELFVVGPVALLLASIVGYFLAGLGLRPVESMRRRAAAISAERPGERLPVPATGDEIERLAKTLNEMLARLEAALARERDFVADAGHELRTPLSLLRAELELALRHADSPAELEEAVRLSIAEVDRLVQLAEALLLIARSDSGDFPLQLENLDTKALMTSVANRFAWRAQEAGRSIVVEAAAGLKVRGDRLRLEQALGNLVDNALRHGEGDVRLRAATVGGAVELHCVDSGPGFPSELLDSAFDRFSRSSHARAGGGSGLGLAIVQVVASAHDGVAFAANLAGGGADVWLALPEQL